MSLLARFNRWLHQLFCRHDEQVYRTIGKTVQLECTSCLRRTSGWNLEKELVPNDPPTCQNSNRLGTNFLSFVPNQYVDLSLIDQKQLVMGTNSLEP